jgi:hypothetical protein
VKTIIPFALFLSAFICAALTPSPAIADPPPSVVGLLPAGARIDPGTSDWMSMDTLIMGGVRASFPGTPRNCFRLNSELTLKLNGNSAFESLLDLVETMEQESLEQTEAGLRREAAQRASPQGIGSLDVVSVGPVTEERLPNGILYAYEYTENCANRANATVGSLRGHARKGTTMLSFSLLMNTGLADGRAKAIEIFDRFEKFDPEAAARGQ